MSNLNTDILYLIAEYIKPNPVIYSKLALVSRDFYTVFSNDSLWKHLNPNDCQHNIYLDYQKSSTAKDKQIMPIAWGFDYQLPRKPPNTANLYNWLGYVVHSDQNTNEIAKNLPQEYYHFDKFWLCAISLSGYAIQWARKDLLGIREYAIAAVSNFGGAIELLPHHLKNDREIIFAAISKDVYWAAPLHSARVDVKSDRELVLRAVQVNGEWLKYASDQFKADKHVVEVAVAQCATAFLESSLQNDRDMAIRAAGVNGEILKYAKTFQSDFDVVMSAVTCNGSALEFASDELKDNYDIVHRAVKHCSTSIKFASERLRDNYDLVWFAISLNGQALEYASQRLRDNRDVVLRAIKTDGASFAWAKAFHGDKDMILTAVKRTDSAFCFLPDTIKSDYEFVQQVVSLNAWAVMYVVESLEGNRDLLLAAIKQNGWIYLDLNHFPELHNDKEILLEAIKTCDRAVRWAPEHLQYDKDIIAASVTFTS